MHEHLASAASSVGVGRAEPCPPVCTQQPRPCSQLHRLRRPWMWRPGSRGGAPGRSAPARFRPGERPVHLGEGGAWAMRSSLRRGLLRSVLTLECAVQAAPCLCPRPCPADGIPVGWQLPRPEWQLPSQPTALGMHT